MGYYDFFSHFYDASVEKHYVPHRALAAEALDLREGLSVLDLPCGTGGCFAAVRPALGDDGHIVGVDPSRGMLKQAAAKVETAGWSHVHLVRSGVDALSSEHLAPVGGSVDRLLVFLGMSAFPDMDGGFANAWSLLKPGGRCVLVDVHAERLGFQGRMVNLTARADITRRFWEPLESRCEGFARRDLPSSPAHGGTMMLATGSRPA
jgi:ubiquinone/menaquinone biosynthesis C-methylase UbiE